MLSRVDEEVTCVENYGPKSYSEPSYILSEVCDFDRLLENVNAVCTRFDCFPRPLYDVIHTVTVLKTMPEFI